MPGGYGGYITAAPGADTIRSGDLAAGSVVGDNIASGSITSYGIGSGQVYGHLVGHGSNMASGQLIGHDLASGAVASGNVASGVVTQGRRVLDETRPAGQAVSGVLAVALGSGGGFWVPAERQSGARLPALGVNLTNAASGSLVTVCLYGFVPAPASGSFASGDRRPLWVGSGGLLVNLSGFMAGASSGPGVGAFSGSHVQQVGLAVSGGVFVRPAAAVHLATVSGTYLCCLSGQFPVSGLGADT